MNDRPSGLCPADRADFAQVVLAALDTAEIRGALSTDPTGRAALRLRTWALAAETEIAAAVPDEYGAHVAARAPTDGVRTAPPARNRPTGRDLRLPPAALMPLISALSAAVLLLIGYGLRLAGAATRFAGSVRTAGWTLAVVALAGAGIGLSALSRTVPRTDGGPDTRSAPGTPPRRSAPGQPAGPGGSGAAADAERARQAWRQALLDRGVLPYLRRRLPESLTP
ncbi:hypothetical protein ACJ6WF_03225 [Streptomyces sp. MMS24-I2-30]|uniref:hypothetical protein n=1 Tax=Streptomyces sp. MMS24-I2-30 TaxID=3351564 RepID=UPI0038969F8C